MKKIKTERQKYFVINLIEGDVHEFDTKNHVTNHIEELCDNDGGYNNYSDDSFVIIEGGTRLELYIEEQQKFKVSL